MFTTTANVITKRRGGILHVFNKAITDLEKLDTDTKSQIEKQEEKIKKEQDEKNALELEQKYIVKITGNMKAVLGIGEVEFPEEKED